MQSNTYLWIHVFERMDVQTTGMYYIRHSLTFSASRLKRCLGFIRCRDKPPCTELHMERRKEWRISSETNIVFGVWMRVWIAFTPSPWVLFTQREAQTYPSSRRLWCGEPGCRTKPHARRSWLCCPRWRSAALMEDLLLQSAHGWRGCALRCVWSWAVLRLETFCLHMLTDVHHASWKRCAGSLKFWLSFFKRESHWIYEFIISKYSCKIM